MLAGKCNREPELEKPHAQGYQMELLQPEGMETEARYRFLVLGLTLQLE
jgi:hypothetical protein